MVISLYSSNILSKCNSYFLMLLNAHEITIRQTNTSEPLAKQPCSFKLGIVYAHENRMFITVFVKFCDTNLPGIS